MSFLLLAAFPPFHSMAKLVFLLTSWSPNLSQGFNLSLLLSVKFTQLSRHFTNLLHFFKKKSLEIRDKDETTLFSAQKKPSETEEDPQNHTQLFGWLPTLLGSGAKTNLFPRTEMGKKGIRVRNEGEGGEGCQLSQSQLEEDG